MHGPGKTVRYIAALLRPEFIVAATMTGMGWSLAAYPTVGAGLYLSDLLDSWHLSLNFFSLVLVFCALIIGRHPRNSTFVLLTAPFLLYIVVSFLYFLVTPNINPAFLFIYGGYYGLMISLYFMRRVDNESGSGQGIH